MDVVCIFVAADGAHVRIQTLTGMEPVVFQSVALPFCKRMDDLGSRIILFFDPEGYRALHTVQIVVHAGLRAYEQRS